MKSLISICITAFFLATSVNNQTAAETGALCKSLAYDDKPYVACTFDPSVDDIRLFLDDDNGQRFRHFSKLATALEQKGQALLFAMNAGMYARNRAPIGHYIEKGVESLGVNTNDGPGNFHLKPNGVFYVTSNSAGVLESEAYIKAKVDARYATQSGPMLVVNGRLHPKFLAASDSLKRRNGVGVRKDGRVVFAISDEPVTFHEFARLFRDELKTPNALFLDGTISRIYAPELGRNDLGVAMGPIVGVVAPQ